MDSATVGPLGFYDRAVYGRDPLLGTAGGIGPSEVAVDRELIGAIRALNKVQLFGEKYELTFVLDRSARQPVLRIVNRETREVVRQIPEEYALQLARELSQASGQLQG